MGRLTGKVAFVTGGARGIGRAIATRFASEGAALVVADKREELGTETAEAIRTEGGQALFVPLDICQEEAWAEAVATATREFGRVDVLVNNAGIIRVRPFLETSLEELRAVLETNLVGAFLGMQAVVPAMKDAGGSIVNFSSVQGIEGRDGLAAYTAAKFGVRGLSKSVAIELGEHGIRVNTVFPGPTKTAMTKRKGWTDAQYDEAYQGYPLGRMANADEVANMALFLASDESSFCTGGDFVVDGGVTAGKPRS